MKSQRGVALITVLLVVAIVTVVCAGMIARQQLSIRSTANQMQARQAWHYALGGEILAISVLQRDWQTDVGAGEPATDHLLEPWALPLPAFDIEQGRIQVRIEDLSGRFNLNSLTNGPTHNEAALAQFRRLLLRLEISAPYPERLLDWMDYDQQPSGDSGAEDNAYLLLDPPYRTANRRLNDLSELRLLMEMRDEDFQRLTPYVTVLPADAPLNVNTASAMVLSSLDDRLTPGVAQALVQSRRDGFRNTAAFLAHPAMNGIQIEGTSLAVGSQFFQATSDVQLADRRLALVSLLQRTDDGEVRVLQRNLGQPPRLPAQSTEGD